MDVMNAQEMNFEHIKDNFVRRQNRLRGVSSDITNVEETLTVTN